MNKKLYSKPYAEELQLNVSTILMVSGGGVGGGMGGGGGIGGGVPVKRPGTPFPTHK